MIMHVVGRASSSELVSRVIVATDDQRIAEEVMNHGAEARLTSSDAASGTDRVAQVAESIDCEIIVNVQGDEPLIEPSTIDAAIQPLIDDFETQIATTSEPILSVDDVLSPSVVKVVTDARGFALYFSRSPIPRIRTSDERSLEQVLRSQPELLLNYRKHSGLYAYRKSFLIRFSSLPQSPLERLEALEQLRVLENGYRIRVVQVEHRSIGVDTEQDYNKVKKLIEEKEK